jgi:hypothetical protein
MVIVHGIVFFGELVRRELRPKSKRDSFRSKADPGRIS